MVRLLLALFPFLVACASCQTVKDQAQAPAELDQDRVVLMTGEVSEVGILGLISNQSVLIRSYAAGTATIRGMNECGFVTSGAVDKLGWIPLDTSILPNKEVCLYSIQVRTNKFDAPAIGHLLIRRFLDPNVKPLRTEMNHVVRDGVNWVQLRAEPDPSASHGVLAQLPGGINESHDIVIYLNGHSGKLNITGCGMPPDVIEYSGAVTLNLTVDYLYRQKGHITESCLFTLTANHDDALKESATLFVKTYQGVGSFLDAPFAKVGSDACFSFQDPYVVGISVNGAWTMGKAICVDRAPVYVVEGTTSRHRVFYGIYSGTAWTEMK